MLNEERLVGKMLTDGKVWALRARYCILAGDLLPPSSSLALNEKVVGDVLWVPNEAVLANGHAVGGVVHGCIPYTVVRLTPKGMYAVPGYYALVSPGSVSLIAIYDCLSAEPVGMRWVGYSSRKFGASPEIAVEILAQRALAAVRHAAFRHDKQVERVQTLFRALGRPVPDYVVGKRRPGLLDLDL